MNAADLKTRLAERDQRMAADTRTDAQRWLGDPPPRRSALARHNTHRMIDQLISKLRRR
jgi:hypothetical protein